MSEFINRHLATKLTSDNISNVLDFASAIEQFQNMHKISVPAASLVSADIRGCGRQPSG